MVTVPQAIMVIYPNAIPLTDFVVSDNVITFWNTGIGPQPTPQQLAAVTDQQVANGITADERTDGKNIYGTDTDGQAKLYRAVANVALDEINIVRAWTVSLKAAVAAATSLANLQTRVAALDTLNARTMNQLANAIDAKIDGGTVD